MLALTIVAVAYLLGSIPFGYLIVRATEGTDVRTVGSGGTGATNVSRRAGKGAGVLTLLLDAAKGAVAVLLARLLITSDFGIDWWVAVAGLAVVVGHIFPVWLKFRGGKGVATGLGVFLMLAPAATLCAALLFFAVVWTTRYVSLGSVAAVAAFPVCVWLVNVFVNRSPAFTPIMATSLLGGVLIIFMHRANIGRLLRGTESKFGRD